MDPLDLLSRSELFAGASAADLEPLSKSALTRRYARGDLIWGAGDSADAIHLILAGEVAVSRIGPDGEEYVVELYMTGDVVGQLHLFEPSPVRMLDARAVAPTTSWVVAVGDVMRLLEKNPKLMGMMLRTYARWIRLRDLRSAEFQNDGRLVEAALQALADEPVSVVATLPAGDLAQFSIPANARVERFVPHGPLVDRAVCAVTHAGMGATQKALARGVPVCAVPFGRDQLEVARRVEIADAGTRLPAKRLNAERLRDKVREAMT